MEASSDGPARVQLNYKLQAQQVMSHEGTVGTEYFFAAVDAKNVVLTAMKKTEDGVGLLLALL